MAMQCVAAAFTREETQGVWGGLSQRERNGVLKVVMNEGLRKAGDTISRFQNAIPEQKVILKLVKDAS